MAIWTQQRVSATCKDLLYIPQTAIDAFSTRSPDSVIPKVDFLHRTVYEFLNTDKQRQIIDSRVPRCFITGSVFQLIDMMRMKLNLYFDDRVLDQEGGDTHDSSPVRTIRKGG